MIFNRLFKKKLEIEVDLYILKKESTPLALDAKLSINKNEISIYNSSKKYIFNENNIHDFKYHEIDMCQFKYLQNGLVEEYGLVFSEVKNMYYFYKYIMLSYLNGNIILTRKINLYKYTQLEKKLFKKNYFAVLIFNTSKCEHILVVVRSNKVKKEKCANIQGNEKDVINIDLTTLGTEQEENKCITISDDTKSELAYDKECEQYYEEFSIKNLKELYKRNKVFLIYILNSFNDIYLGTESIGLHIQKYFISNMLKFIEYKTLYSDGENYKKYYVEDSESSEDISNSANIDDKENTNICEIKKGKEKCLDKINKENNVDNDDNLGNEINKLNEKLLIIIESNKILIEYIRNILIYRHDFKNNIIHIKQNYADTHLNSQVYGKYSDIDERERNDSRYSDNDKEDNDDNKSKHYSVLSDFENSDNLDDNDSNSDMKYKYVNTNEKYSFVFRQNYMPSKGRRNNKKNKWVERREKREHIMDKIETELDDMNYDNVLNDLSIYKFDEYGKEKKIYNSKKNLFEYKNEKCIPKNAHINDHEGTKIIVLNEKNENNLFMIDINSEKIIRKWDTEYIPIIELLKKEENIYCGYNKSSIYYVDTRIKNCIQNQLQYSKNTPGIEHASMDKYGRIALSNTHGEIKYFDGKLNKYNTIKNCKNSIFCSNDIVDLIVSQDGLYSVITCEKNVIICENVIENNNRNDNVFEKLIKKSDRSKQKKILLQIHYIDVFTYNLGNYVFIKSLINNDNSLIFTFSKQFYVVWYLKEAINNQISYIIKKVNDNISDMSFYNTNNIQGIIMATENSLKSKQIKYI
ncbi:conserved Plasmodium protein, unknown function [Plasmodium vinckei vinckei]|uniref:Vacuolar import/degradation Vid27 C-terminal domain-containing protein n=1 Tax=Plasmodium vinckei vinckei TaxID=54757 RepID=A0A449C0S3_PLAVN|nr:conserved Plasmodium protein, unknown function [Plasmodium vinckei vinckei]VEV59284.1 conserved Plasmodium protein, unknown function [Plasmodium vinckei vinckei]